jgi:hypothetical protein
MGCCQVTRVDNIEVIISTINTSERYTQNNRDISISGDELRDLSLESLDPRENDIICSKCDELSKKTTLNSCDNTQKPLELGCELKNRFNLECAMRLNILKRNNTDVLFNYSIDGSTATPDILTRNCPSEVQSSGESYHNRADRSYSLSLNFKPSLTLLPSPPSSFCMHGCGSGSVSSHTSYCSEVKESKEYIGM